jgi:hypothetical protein
VPSTSHALYVSPAIVDLLGHDLDRWHSNPALFEELVHPDDRERVLDLVTAAKKSAVRTRASTACCTRAAP